MPASASRSRVSSVSARARAFPAAGRPARQLPDRLHRAGDCGPLVFGLVHGLLHEAMAHELPPGPVRGLAGFGIKGAGRAIHGEGRFQPPRAEHVEETPEADAQAVFVPGPVRDVGQQGLAHGRRQHGARHGAGRAPVLDVDNGPDRDPGVAGQNKGRAPGDGHIIDAAAHAAADGVRHPCHSSSCQTVGRGRRTAFASRNTMPTIATSGTRQSCSRAASPQPNRVWSTANR